MVNKLQKYTKQSCGEAVGAQAKIRRRKNDTNLSQNGREDTPEFAQQEVVTTGEQAEKLITSKSDVCLTLTVSITCQGFQTANK